MDGIRWRLYRSEGYVVVVGVNGQSQVTQSSTGGVTTSQTGYDALYGYTVFRKDAALHTWTYAKDSHDMVLNATDANGATSLATYDAANHPLTNTSPIGGVRNRSWAADKTLSSETSPANVTTTYVYNGQKLLQSMTSPSSGTTSYVYDGQGNLTSTTMSDGRADTMTYDALGRVTSQSSAFNATTVTTSFVLDVLGRVTQETQPAVLNRVSGVTHQARVTKTFDMNGNRTQTVISDLTGGDISRTSSATFDNNDREVSSTDALGFTMSREYDQVGLVKAVIDQLGRRTETNYNSRGWPLSVVIKGYTNPVVGGAPRDITASVVTYDNDGRKLTMRDTLLRTVAFTYSPNGQVLTEKLLAFHRPWRSKPSAARPRSTPVPPRNRATTRSETRRIAKMPAGSCRPRRSTNLAGWSRRPVPPTLRRLEAAQSCRSRPVTMTR